MRTFAAAAIAASANASAMAVPDFIAGFIYGMTGDNDLTEIEACYQGGDQIVTDVKTAVADFNSGNMFAGLKEMGVAWNEVGSAMTTCQGMDDDIQAIEQWATIFTHPTELAKTVGKNWLLHGRKIKKDIASEESDWSAGNYFQAGADIADALTLATGGIKTQMSYEEANLNIEAPFLFLGGFLDGMAVDNNLAELQTCGTDAEVFVTDVEALIADLNAGDMIKAARQAKKTLNEVSVVTADCESMQEDLTALKSWASIFTNVSQLVETVGKHMVFHKSEIMSDAHMVSADWSSGMYFASGKAAADLMTVAIGPVKEAALLQGADVGGLCDTNADCNSGWCNIHSIPHVCGDPDANGADVGEPCDVNSDCTKGWCNIHSIPHVCGDPDEALFGAAGVGEACEANGDCELGWCNMWAIPHTCGDPDASNDGEPCSDDTDCPIAGLQYCGEDGACHSKCAANDFACFADADIVGMDLLELPKMAAGFVYGMVGENHLSEFEACYAGVSPLEGYLSAALSDLEQFHIIAAMKQFEEFVYHFQLDVAPCHNMGDDVAAIEAWAQIFKSPTSLVSTATKHYLLHKKAIKADIASIHTDMDASDYFKTGEEAADILTILLGPIE